MIRLHWQEIKIPQQFFYDEDYKHMSNNAKLLYGLLAKRLEHEIILEQEYQNEFQREYVERGATKDEDGNIYINFPLEEVKQLLNISGSTACKLFKELENADLIARKKPGMGKPDNIYVGIAKDEKAPPPWRTTPETDNRYL